MQCVRLSNEHQVVCVGERPLTLMLLSCVMITILSHSSLSFCDSLTVLLSLHLMLECILPRAPRTNIHIIANEFPNFMLSARRAALLYFDVAAAHMHTTIFGAEHADVLLLQCDTKSVSRCHILISKEKWHTFQWKLREREEQNASFVCHLIIN
jgi:hypothetical protein